MAGLVKKFLASVSVVGMSAVFGAPAMAANLGVSVTGTDYLLYASGEYPGWDWNYQGVQGNRWTYLTEGVNPNNAYILGGDSANPLGNIELGASNEYGTNERVTLTTQDSNGTEITIRNIDQEDWEQEQENGRTLSENYIHGIAAQLAPESMMYLYNNYWVFSEEVNTRLSNQIGDGTTETEERQALSSIYSSLNEEQMLDDVIAESLHNIPLIRDMIMGMASDPNISYINEENGEVRVGLAGHYDLYNRVAASEYSLFAGLFSGVQMSEIFAYTYGGRTRYGWSDQATFSGQVNWEDSNEFRPEHQRVYSHSGNYEVTLVEDVPEPSTVLGLMAIGGLVAATKRQSKKQG